MLQKLPTESFQWIGKTSQFNEVCVCEDVRNSKLDDKGSI